MTVARKFDLAALMGDVSNLNTPEIVTQQIPLSQIETNDRNFYEVEDVTELKESIELIGLKQPLVVLEVDDTHYRLIAGHRRYKALTELGRESAPCVVQRNLTETQEQLALILTNSTARELTYLEKAEQAVRLKRLFIKRREEGAELPGRIRDMVAEAMQESASNIARMEAIDKHLVGEWKRALKKGQINASTAYELSKLDKDVQKKLRDEMPYHANPSAKVIKAAGEIVRDYPFAPLICPEYYNSPCTPIARSVLPWLQPVPAGLLSRVRPHRGLSGPVRRVQEADYRRTETSRIAGGRAQSRRSIPTLSVPAGAAGYYGMGAGVSVWTMTRVIPCVPCAALPT